MQYLLTEEEYKNLVSMEIYRREQQSFNDASRRLLAFGMAVNEHPDADEIWERQREVLYRAEKANPELFKAGANLLCEKDEFGNVLVDYGVAEYAKEKEK